MDAKAIYVGPAEDGYRQGALTPAFREAVQASGGTLSDSPEHARAVVYNGPANGIEAVIHPELEWLQLPSGGADVYLEAGLFDDIPYVTSGKGGPFADTVGEQGVALLLAGARRIAAHARATSWAPTDTWWGDDTLGLSGKTVVIFGCGAIGAGLLARLGPFGVRTVAVTRGGDPVPAADVTVASEDCEAVLPEADFLVIAAPLTPATRGYFDDRRLAMLKPTCWVVTLSRGELVDTAALTRALQDDRLGGAALEIVDPMPLPDDHPLWHDPRALIVPHTATLPRFKVPAMAERVRVNVERYLAGRRDLLGLLDVRLGY
jgi:phosphoglycerate dehydrogenase-like enzyme